MKRQPLAGTLHKSRVKPAISFLDEITGSVQEEIDDSVTSLAGYTGLRDLNSIYILNFSERQYISNHVHTDTSFNKNSRDITSCSNSNFAPDLDLRNTLGLRLVNNRDHLVEMSMSSWPAGANSGMPALETVPRTIFVVYCISCVFIALIVLGIEMRLARRL